MAAKRRPVAQWAIDGRKATFGAGRGVVLPIEPGKHDCDFDVQMDRLRPERKKFLRRYAVELSRMEGTLQFKDTSIPVGIRNDNIPHGYQIIALCPCCARKVIEK